MRRRGGLVTAEGAAVGMQRGEEYSVELREQLEDIE